MQKLCALNAVLKCEWHRVRITSLSSCLQKNIFRQTQKLEEMKSQMNWDQHYITVVLFAEQHLQTDRKAGRDEAANDIGPALHHCCLVCRTTSSDRPGSWDEVSDELGPAVYHCCLLCRTIIIFKQNGILEELKLQVNWDHHCIAVVLFAEQHLQTNPEAGRDEVTDELGPTGPWGMAGGIRSQGWGRHDPWQVHTPRWEQNQGAFWVTTTLCVCVVCVCVSFYACMCLCLNKYLCVYDCSTQ